MSRSNEDAERLESMFARIARTLFRTSPDDPIADLPVAQVKMLRLLAAGPRTPSDLSSELGHSLSAITQVANRLEALGIVTRTEDPKDRRVRYLALNELGKSRMAARQITRLKTANQILNDLSLEEQNQIMESMERLVEACTAFDATQNYHLQSVQGIEVFIPGNLESRSQEAS